MVPFPEAEGPSMAMTGIGFGIRGYSAARGRWLTKRRRLLLAGAGLLSFGTAVHAQQSARKYHVAVFFSLPQALHAPYRKALAARLAAHGFVEGKNLTIDSRVVSGHGLDRDRQQAATLLAAKPDAFFTTTARVTQAALAEAR